MGHPAIGPRVAVRTEQAGATVRVRQLRPWLLP
jgi:hypothetical protein